MSVDVEGIVAGGEGLALPVFVPSGADSLELLTRIATAVEALGAKTTSAAESGARSQSSWERLREELLRGAEAYNHITQSARDVAAQITATVEHFAAASSATDRLSRAQHDLGLNFEAAADGAGGYVDQMQVATAASTLAERGIRLTQTELNALAEVAQSYARTTGKEFSEVMESLTETVTEGGEELGKFDTRLLRVADTARFTANDRLHALVQRAGEITPAARTATESIEAMRAALTDADRVFSSAFVDGIARLNDSGDATNDFRTKVRELNDDIRAAGSATAEVVSRVANGVGALVGGLATGVASVLTGLGAIGAGMAAVIQRRNPLDAAQAYMRDAADNGLLGEFGRFTANRMVALERLSAEGDERTTAAPQDPVADMVFTQSDAAAAARDARARRTRTGGGPDGILRTAAAKDAALKAERNARVLALLGGSSSEDLTRGSLSDALHLSGSGEITLPDDGKREQRVGAASGATAEDRFEAFRKGRDEERTRQREHDDLEEQYQAQLTFTERWEVLHRRRVHASEEAANSLQKVFSSLGDALSKHFEALLKGQESAGEAALAVVNDVLGAVGKEAFGKMGFFLAEGFGLLVSGNLPAAGTAFAASAAYGAAAAAITGLGVAIGGGSAPSKPAVSGSGGGSAPSSARTSSAASEPTSSGATTVVNHYYAPVIGGRSATDAEVGTRLARFDDAAARRTTRDR